MYYGGNMIEVTTANFKEEILNSGIPVCADFWAEWCMPCKLIMPIVDELSKEYAGNVKFVKVNVDESPELATEMQVMSIPQLIIFKGGERVGQISGVNNKAFMKNEIENALKSS